MVTTPAVAPPREAASPVAPVRGDPKPPPSGGDQQQESEAVEALRALQADTKVGLTYEEYSPRVREARVVVDSYIRDGAGDERIKEEVRRAMALYLLASSAWNARNSKKYEGSLADAPALKYCPAVKKEVDKAQGSDAAPRSVAREMAVAAGVELLWRCGSERIAEIDRLRAEVGRR
jgi:hypothetical protein